MFVRTVKAKQHTYVRIVENYRKGGKSHQRIIANLGNLRLQKKALVQIIEGLRRLVDKLYVTEEEIAPQNGPEYGRMAAGIHLWRELGLEVMLERRFARTKAKEVGPIYALCMTLNRLCAPESKLGIFRWLEDVYVPGWRLPRIMGEKEHKEYAERFYRTLDYLERWKSGLEKELYLTVRDMFHFRVDVVFYDVTRTHFEGAGPRGLAKRGYSPKGNPQDKQIVIGVVLCHGLPIAHYVFEGNRADKTTVEEVARDLKERFQIGRFIFVGDRGMVSRKIIEFLEKEEIDYVVALRRRQCLESARAIEVEVDATWEEVGCVRAKEVVGAYKDLWEIEWAFRDLKDFIQVRPIRHYKERRVRGHVLVCVWALLIQRVLQKKLHDAEVSMSSRMALQSLRTIKAIETEVGPKQITFITHPNPRNLGILKALGLRLPKVLVE